MDYKKTAEEILKQLGGAENVQSATHCVTRLRLKLNNESIVDDETIKNIPGVIGVMRKAGQYQIIMGNDVNNYYRAFTKLGNFGQATETKETQKKNAFEFIIDVISSSMAPVVPAMLAGGMIKVLLIILPLIHLLSTDSQTYAILTFFGDAPFYFIPIMLAFTAAQKFGVTPMLAVSVAGIMLHPNFTALVAEGSPLTFFGLPVTLASYASSVIPILIMVWLMQYIENFFNKIIPAVMKTFMQPLLVLFVSGLIALVVVGPLGIYAGEGLSTIVVWIQTKAGWFALGLLGAFMPLIVMTGMHWAFAPLFLIASPATPDVLMLPAMLASNLAQGAASLAVALKAKNPNTKQIGLAAGISALVAGVTEPALYGITLKYKTPLYAAMIAGGISGIYVGISGLESYAFAVPSLVALPQFIGGEGNSNIINAIIVAVASIVLTFILTWILWKEEPVKAQTKSSNETKMQETSLPSGSSDPKKVSAPLQGKVVPLNQVNDAVFSTKMMGEGIAILPENDLIVAPFDGVVTAVFPTKHAIGLTSDHGIEVLIHVGIDTVELNGAHFETFVVVDQKIKQGEPLLKADFAAIKAAGYDTVTPIIVTNTAQYIEVVAKEELEQVDFQDALIYVV